jgi:hypothetical protein
LSISVSFSLSLSLLSPSQHNPRASSQILKYFPTALRLLLQLHRELKCPRRLHESFWLAHRTPTHANLATILSRVIQLAESRVLLFDLLKACLGNPSPRLLTRMLEDSKRKQEEKVANVDLFARLNYFGQSSDQIRARARATTALSLSSEASITESGDLPDNLDELRLLIRGTSQDESRSSPRKSIVPKDGKGSPQILKPSQMIQVTASSNQQSALLKRYASSKAPSMEMITEDHDEEEDEEDEDEGWEVGEEDADADADGEGSRSTDPSGEDDERKRQESIRKFVQARFSGRESASNLTGGASASRAVTRTPSFVSTDANDATPPPTPSPIQTTGSSLMRTIPPPTPSPSIAVEIPSPIGQNPSSIPKPRMSKRVSMHCVHPKLLEKICHEWMDSVPWKVCIIILLLAALSVSLPLYVCLSSPRRSPSLLSTKER